MHSTVYVIVSPDGCPESETLESLDPFCVDTDVPPYQQYLSPAEVQEKAEEYAVSKYDLTALAKSMAEKGMDVGVDATGLFRWSTFNPYGKWDSYHIGGAYDRYIYGISSERDPFDECPADQNTIAISQLLALPDETLLGRLPDSLLLPNGRWLDQFPFKNRGWHDFELEKKSNAEWLAECRRVLAQYPNHRAVCVDAHS